MRRYDQKKKLGGQRIDTRHTRMTGTKYKLQQQHIVYINYLYEVKIETNRAIITPYYLNIKINTFIMTR